LWLVLPAAAQSSQGPQTSQGSAPAPQPDRLTSIAHSDKQVWNAVVIAPDRRVFVEFPRLAGNTEPALATIDPQGGLVPYPGGAWTEPTAPDAKTDPGQAFIGLDAIRLGPDNSLWAVDSGVPGFGRAALAGAAKLVRIDLATNAVTRTYILPPDVLRPKSVIGDVRFNGAMAYVTDAGSPALIVLDLATGSARRLLDHDPSTTAQRPIIVDGDILKGPDNKPATIHASRLEVTPDGRYLYYQPLPGPMYRIPTALLDDAKASPQALAAGVEFWYDTPTLGGTAISASGTLYLNDVEHDSVLSLTPDRVLSTVIQDPRLHWADAPFLHDGLLTLPVTQFDRAPMFHHGKSLIRYPVELFDLRLAALPSAGAAR
jgi:sugar lactone lactonase YvrE